MITQVRHSRFNKCAGWRAAASHELVRAEFTRALYVTTAFPLHFLRFVSFFTNILLFQDILPISIYVSLDVVKTIQARMIQWDRVMCSPPSP